MTMSFLGWGTLAQLVEQRTFNPLVAGSSPARPTNIFKATLCHAKWLFLWRKSCACAFFVFVLIVKKY